MWKLVGPLLSVYRLDLFFPDVYRFPDPLVHSVAFFVDHLGKVQVYDMVKNGVQSAFPSECWALAHLVFIHVAVSRY